MRIGILCGERAGPHNAIRDATDCLVDALRPLGHSAITASDLGRLRDCEAIVIQYNPFLYGRRGFAPGLPIGLWRLRLRQSRPLLALIVHEPFVPMKGWRWVLMGLWQRFQLMLIRAACDRVAVTIEAWVGMLRWMRPRKPTFILPVGSNFPDRRSAITALRTVGQQPLIVATFGNQGGGRSPEHIQAALAAVIGNHERVRLLALGPDGAAPEGLPDGVEVDIPGYLSAREAADRLATADLFLAPFRGGVSTRRGSVMAALQHGIPTVATSGPFTDHVLKESGALKLVPSDRIDLFAEATVQLASDREARAALGIAGRQLYERSFDWSVLARRLVNELGIR